MLSREALLCFLFCPAAFSIYYLWDAVHHLFTLGKSKTKIKKENLLIPLYKKILLVGYAKRCEYHISVAKYLCYVYWGYLLITLVCTAFWMLSIIDSSVEEVFSLCVLAKVFIFDIPVNIYSFIMTKHDKKHGGVTWVWTDKD